MKKLLSERVVDIKLIRPEIRNPFPDLPMCKQNGNVIETAFIPGYSNNSFFSGSLTVANNDVTNLTLETRLARREETRTHLVSQMMPGFVADGDVEQHASVLESVSVAGTIAFLNGLYHIDSEIDGGMDALKSIEKISIRVSATPGFYTFGPIAVEVLLLASRLFDFSENCRPMLDICGVSGLPQNHVIAISSQYKL